MKRYIHLFIFTLALIRGVHSQSFINGNFEINSAGNTDQINLSNTELNAKLTGVTSFGSYGDVDIINSSAYGGGGAEDKNWYIAITGGGTDIVALSLKSPLVAGKKYSISFYDRKDTRYLASPIQIGLSENNTTFGEMVYTAGESPSDNKWTQRVFSFTAPNNGQYITVKMATGDINHWANIDNFTFTSVTCNTLITLESSARDVEKGQAVTFTVSGGNDYTWAPDLVMNNATGNTITFVPEKTTTYTVSSKDGSCPTLTAGITVTVHEPQKDTTLTKTAPDKKDSVAPQYVKFNKHSLNGRKYKVQETINVSVPLVKVMVWDKNRVDGDIVSVYLNGQLLAENMEVSKVKKEISLPLQSGSNILVLYTVNVGRIPPNTAAIRINDGSNKRRITTLVSDFRKSGAIEIIYNADAVTSK
ncbi:MAG: hypothetical protein JST26_06810 [Bacteroidetes bacterium]|nr:hypothetical protein [Bacteroidota bacterium]